MKIVSTSTIARQLLTLYICMGIVAPHTVSGATFFSDTFTPQELRQKYQESAQVVFGITATTNTKKDAVPEKVKILIVPGHDDKSPGAYFNGVHEKDINLEVAQKLAEYFKDDDRFLVTMSRGADEYKDSIVPYFTKKKRMTELFRKKHVNAMSKLLKKKKVEQLEDGVAHNTASPEVVLKLYGINKWVNDNDYDIVLHIHFNDYAERRAGEEGTYSGFALYVPEKQYSNSKTSIAIAEHIQESLDDVFPQSDYPKESAGIIEDQELIAVGAFNTLDAAAVLIEYGYLAESHFTHEVTRGPITSELAHRTYAGVKTFFDESFIQNPESTLLPFEWTADLEIGDDPNVDTLALQAALIKEDVYPPDDKTLNECGIRGVFRTCTEASVKLFQEKYQLPTTGVVGPMTRMKLNELY